MGTRGSITKVNGRWKSTIDLPVGPGEKRKQRTRRFDTEEEANRDMTEFLTTVDTRTYVDPVSMTFGEYMTEWVTINAEGREPSTIQGYKSKIDKQIIPQLGHIKLQDLDALDLRRFYHYLLTEGRLDGPGGLAKSTVRQIHFIIHGALEAATELNLVPFNEADKARGAKPPSRKAARPPEMKTWEQDELEAFYGLLDKHPKRVLFILAGETGMRRAELCGLRWRDVDFDANGDDGGRISVRQTIQKLADIDTSIGVPKSGEARLVDIDPQLVALLRAHKAAQAAEKLKLGAAYADHGLVFARPTGIRWSPDGISQAFDRVVATSGLPRIRLHDLRHTHATLWLEAGIDPKIVSERLGHASVAFTLDTYRHVKRKEHVFAAKRMASNYGI